MGGLSVVDGSGLRITFKWVEDYVLAILGASEDTHPDTCNEIVEQGTTGGTQLRCRPAAQ